MYFFTYSYHFANYSKWCNLERDISPIKKVRKKKSPIIFENKVKKDFQTLIKESREMKINVERINSTCLGAMLDSPTWGFTNFAILNLFKFMN